MARGPQRVFPGSKLSDLNKKVMVGFAARSESYFKALNVAIEKGERPVIADACRKIAKSLKVVMEEAFTA